MDRSERVGLREHDLALTGQFQVGDEGAGPGGPKPERQRDVGLAGHRRCRHEPGERRALRLGGRQPDALARSLDRLEIEPARAIRGVTASSWDGSRRLALVIRIDRNIEGPGGQVGVQRRVGQICIRPR